MQNARDQPYVIKMKLTDTNTNPKSMNYLLYVLIPKPLTNASQDSNTTNTAATAEINSTLNV